MKKGRYFDFLLNVYKIYLQLTHIIARITKKYYFEDYLRVYPDGLSYNPLGIKKPLSKEDIKNFLNHSKFYKFAAQFVKNKCVVDVGCGSGYGGEILKKTGAKLVYGSDISKHSINFAKSHFGNLVNFSLQTIIDLNEYRDNMFDITISSEVLEHIKEYGKEDKALKELKRVTKDKGLIIIGTPNNELLEDHGFSFEEIQNLLKSNFSKFCIFENALYPPKDRKYLWEKRVAKKNVGIIISQNINVSETAVPDGMEIKLKKGIKPGIFNFSSISVNTKLLHNTNSWVILAINNKLK